MNEQYAIDPAVAQTPSDLQLLLHLFDAGNGRFVSKFPYSWPEQLAENLRCSPELATLYGAEAAQRFSHVLLPTKVPYKQDLAWIKNAESIRMSVAAVIGGPGCPAFAVPLSRLSPDRLADSRGDHIRMNINSYEQAMFPLFQVSPTVCLVDRFFRIRQRSRSKQGWECTRKRELLKLLLKLARDGRRTELLRLTVSRKHGLEEDYDGVALLAEARRVAAEVDNHTTRIEFQAIEDLASPVQHGRYLLGVGGYAAAPDVRAQPGRREQQSAAALPND